MHPDVMVGEGRAERPAPEWRHVAADTAAHCVDRTDRAPRQAVPTAGGPGLAGVAVEATVVVARLGPVGVVVRVVAGHAVEGACALGVAAAPWEGHALEPDPER